MQTSRWKVDIAAPLLAHLPLSAIHLPGGIFRRRTTTDELAIRSFFSEGDLLVAEVQSVFHDGAAGLHTRSLRYGKLRNGVFLAVTSGVVRAKRQVWTVATAHAGGDVDVVLGVNDYIWICAHTSAALAAKAKISRADLSDRSSTNPDQDSETIYLNRNDPIAPATRRKIARLAGCIAALTRARVRVDEEMIMRAYDAAVEISDEEAEEENDRDENEKMNENEQLRRRRAEWKEEEKGNYLDDAAEKRVVRMALTRGRWKSKLDWKVEKTEKRKKKSYNKIIDEIAGKYVVVHTYISFNQRSTKHDREKKEKNPIEINLQSLNLCFWILTRIIIS